MQTVDHSLVRSINQRVIMEAIIKNKSASKAELSRMLDISKPAMSEIIKSLLDIGIVKECGPGDSAKGGGRKPLLLTFNSEYKYIISIDLNYKDPIFALGNLFGEILDKFSIKIAQSTSFEKRVEMVSNAVSILLNSKNISKNDLGVIAISSPGVIHEDTDEYISNTQFVGWSAPNLRNYLKEKFETPVIIKNDVNTAALGELHFGSAKDFNNIVYISCGLGIGAGLVVNSRLYEGSKCAAGEIANFISRDKLALSPGYNLESEVSIDALLKKVKENSPDKTRILLDELAENIDNYEFEHVVEAWMKQDEFITECINEIGSHLGCAISNIVSLLNCDLVVLGGEYTVFKKQLIPKINEIVKKHAFYPVTVVPSKLEKYSGIYGLFAIARNLIIERSINSPSSDDM